MTTTTYYIYTGNDDFYTNNLGTSYYSTPLLEVNQNSATFPPVSSYATCKVDTSGIPEDDIISDGTLYLDENDYTASGGVSKLYQVQQLRNAYWATIKTLIFTTATTKSFSLDSTSLSYISKTGYSQFRVVVSNPGAGKKRTFHFKAYETSQANAMRLSITHAPPPVTFIPKVMVY